jgi:hypothetical protein
MSITRTLLCPYSAAFISCDSASLGKCFLILHKNLVLSFFRVNWTKTLPLIQHHVTSFGLLLHSQGCNCNCNVFHIQSDPTNTGTNTAAGYRKCHNFNSLAFYDVPKQNSLEQVKVIIYIQI